MGMEGGSGEGNITRLLGGGVVAGARIFQEWR